MQCCHVCWTHSHHCQIEGKNPSKRWSGEFWGFRTCLGFGLAVPPLPHIAFRVCLYNGFLCLISVSFPATTPRATTPHRYLTATTPRATTPVHAVIIIPGSCYRIMMLHNYLILRTTGNLVKYVWKQSTYIYTSYIIDSFCIVMQRLLLTALLLLYGLT